MVRFPRSAAFLVLLAFHALAASPDVTCDDGGCSAKSNRALLQMALGRTTKGNAEAALEEANNRTIGMAEFMLDELRTSEKHFFRQVDVASKPSRPPAENRRLAELTTLVVVVVIVIVVILYAAQGLRVVCCVLAYLTALTIIKFPIKWAANEGFVFSMFLTALHQFASFFVGLLIMLGSSFKLDSLPTMREMWFFFVPVAAAASANVAANNEALIYSTVGFNEIIGSTAPLVMVAFLLTMGKPFHKELIPSVLVVIAGCVFSSAGCGVFSIMGFVLCFAANLFKAVRSSMQQLLLDGGVASRSFTPAEVLAWTSLPGAFLMMACSALWEGMAPINALLHAQNRSSMLLPVFISCAIAAVLNLCILFATKYLGAVGAHLTGNVKTILTVLLGMVIFNEALTFWGAVGFIMIFLGVFSFNSTEAYLKKKQQEEDALNRGSKNERPWDVLDAGKAAEQSKEKRPTGQ